MNTLVAQLNQAATDLPGALVTQWMAWIKLFNFSIKHVSGRKHNAADDLSQRSGNLLSNEEADTVDDFIDSQLNSIQVCLIFMKRPEESAVLEDDYSEKSIRIAVFLTSLQ